MEHKIPVTKEGYCKAMLLLMNFTLNLRKFEIDIMTVILSHGIEQVTTDTRDLIRKILNKDKFNTNNYINRLKAKGILLPTSEDRVLQVNPSILDLIKDKKVSFEFVIHDNNN